MRCPKINCDSTNIVKSPIEGYSICYKCGHESATRNFTSSIDTVGSTGEPSVDKGEKYRKVIVGEVLNSGIIKKYRPVIVDVYDVLVAFNVTDPAVQHAVKKLLAMGQRGHKDKMTDLKEAHWQLERAVQIEERYSGNK